MAALAVVASSYPVIFCGKSYVSPASTYASGLVYDRNPCLPGMPRIDILQQHGDTGAIMWWAVPVGFIESRSILDHHEIPLWNRYGHAGDILLGQAISMLGDPLQLVVIFGRGAAAAWDAKFLLAKLLFCIGCGCLVMRLLNAPLLALLYAALAAYCGAYVFIFNHPSFFVLAYAPWILLSAVEILATPPGGLFKWAALWLAANVSCFNAGHVEAAVVLIGGLNLAALISAQLFPRGHTNRTRIFLRMGAGTLLFLGLTAPVWMSFLVALPQAYTVHAQVKVTQMSPQGILGLFDECFYRWYGGGFSAPGTSLLMLAGVVLSVRRWRYLRNEPFFLVNTGAIVFWAGCVFGLVPASLIAAVPLLNRVGHVQVDFSYLLVIHLTLQSAYGFKSLRQPDSFRQATDDFVAAASIMGAMFIGFHLVSFAEMYRAGYLIPAMSGAHYHLGYFLPCAAGALGAPLLYKYLLSHNGRIGLLGWTGIIMLGFIPNSRFGLYTFGDDDLVLRPGPRMVLNAPSATISQLGRGGEPFRMVGLGRNFAGDYAAVYGLEDIRSCAPLSNGRFVELVQGFPGMALAYQDWEIKVKDPVSAQPLLNLLNVRYVLANPRTPPPENGHFTASNAPDFTVLENQHAWPRAFFTSQIITVSSTEEFIQQLLRHGDQPFAALDREEADQAPELRHLEPESSAPMVAANHYQLLPNSTEFDIHTTGPGIVCLTEGQARDFLATANGKPVKVLTVNRAFKGVYLGQSGNYHVEFRFRPANWNISMSLFCLSAGFMLFWGLLELMRASVPVNRPGGWTRSEQGKISE